MAKIFIEESTLTSIGNAIRGKEGSSDLIPVNEMATRITSLPSGGGGADIEPVVLTGDCTYACAGQLANAFLSKFPDKISTKDIYNGSYMFYNNRTIERVPFELNFQSNSNSLNYMFNGCVNLEYIPNFDAKHISYASMSYLFNNCYDLIQPPYIYNAYPDNINNLFYNSYKIRYIPDDYFSTWNNARITTYNYAHQDGVFNYCYSLRKVPTSFFQLISDSKATTASYTPYYNMFQYCYALDEIVNLPVVTATYTSNAFASAFTSCARLKKLTFQTNEDGTPKTAKWKSQTIKPTNDSGYAYEPSYILNYNSGITEDKLVTDDASYQALKNDPDWWTTNPDYSRYNHDSAVELINSLPDTSAYLATAGGTNTIAFYGNDGIKTDGGAINTLTEEEIAVATAKGWTITLK